jgi:adenylosuccinate synthase
LCYFDLFYPSVLKIKLELIRKYYEFDYPHDVDEFISACHFLTNDYLVGLSLDIDAEKFPVGIFEGSQGILLDQKYGFFPHVTRADTGVNNLPRCDNYYLVTRCYQTRHEGPMTNEDISFDVAESPDESNKTNEFQGNFRRTVLDVDLLKYAITVSGLEDVSGRILTVTCLDQIVGHWAFTYKDRLKHFDCEEDFLTELSRSLKIKTIQSIRSPRTEDTPI